MADARGERWATAIKHRTGLGSALEDLASACVADEEPRLEASAAEGLIPSLVELAGDDSLSEDLRIAAIRCVAELAKSEAVRDALGEAGAVSPVLAFLLDSAADGPLDGPRNLQCLRALGNLAFDHDANRAMMLSGGVVPHLVDLLARGAARVTPGGGGLDDNDLVMFLRVAVGAAGNVMASTDDALAEGFVEAGAIESITRLASRDSNEMVAAMAMKAFQAMWSAKTSEAMVKGGVIEFVLQEARQWGDEDVMDQAWDTLAMISESKAGQDTLISLDAVASIISLPVSFTDEDTLVPATKILAELAGNDDAVPRLLEDDVLAFVRELTNHGLEEVAKNGIMTIGNVIRSDEACAKMMAWGVVPVAFRMMENENLEIQHLAVGAIRNLCIPNTYKQELFDAGAVEAVIPLLLGPHQPIQFYAAAVLRNICKGMPAIATAVAEIGSVLPRLAELGQHEDPENVRTECTRAMVAIMSGRPAGALERVVDHGGVKALSLLARSPHDSLVNEALHALIWLVSDMPDADRAEQAKAEVGQELAERLAAVVRDEEAKASSLAAAGLIGSCLASEAARLQFVAGGTRAAVEDQFAWEADGAEGREDDFAKVIISIRNTFAVYDSQQAN